MNWQIVPYQSVGPLRFGMSPGEVAELLGPTVDVQTNPIPGSASTGLQEAYADYTIEFRLKDPIPSSMPSTHFENGKLVAVDLYEFLQTTELDGFRLFELSKRQALAFLRKKSREYAKGVDGFIFLDLGISISDDSEWEESPPINVFAQGQFDDAIAEGLNLGEIEIIKR